MKREIKFRAYCPILNEYIPQDNVLIDGTGRATFCGYTFKSSEQHSAKLKLEQFIGLSDKNGKEIYEGDKLCNGTSTYIVEWDKYKCGWNIVEYGIHQVEIIGNIHQNPELLKTE